MWLFLTNTWYFHLSPFSIPLSLAPPVPADLGATYEQPISTQPHSDPPITSQPHSDRPTTARSRTMPHAIGHKRPRPPSGQLAHHTALLSEDSSSDEYYNDKGHAGENFFRREPVKERHGKSGGGNQSSARPAGSYVPACGHVEIDGKACFNDIPLCAIW